MKAGRLQYRLALLRPVRQPDAYGSAAATSWQPAGTAWAERVKMTGRTAIEAGERFADYGVE